MPIRFQGDYDFSGIIIRALLRQEPAIDFQTGHQAGLEGLPDDQVLAVAARDGRILVSHDRTTMPYHFANFIAHSNIPGLILISQGFPTLQAVYELRLIWAASTAEEYVNRIVSIPQ
jgi:hypothetical protein